MKGPVHGLIRRSGFTLIELLLVIAIIGVLAAIIIIAVNPAQQLAEANNAQRRRDITAIANAVVQYAADNNGVLPLAVTTVPTVMCATGAATSSECIDLSVLTKNELYLRTLPYDPFSSNTTSTWYVISTTTTTHPRVIVTAPSAENAETISVTR